MNFEAKKTIIISNTYLRLTDESIDWSESVSYNNEKVT